MIKKIICPTDFSPQASNAMNYAAKVAEVIKAELILMNVYQVPLAYTGVMGDAISKDTRHNPQLAASKLKELSNWLEQNYQIKTSYEVDYTVGSLSKTVAMHADGETMIIMGTAGLQYIEDFFLGTHTYQVVKKAKCPVLLVPDNISFIGFNKVVYAVAYEEKVKLALQPFHDFIKPFNPEITFLHISEHDTEISKDVFNGEMDEIEAFYKGNIDKVYVVKEQSYVPENAIEKYMEKISADLLVLVVRHRNVFEALFKRKSIISEISAVPKFPVLILHA